jgi:hypothetical protein
MGLRGALRIISEVMLLGGHSAVLWLTVLEDGSQGSISGWPSHGYRAKATAERKHRVAVPFQRRS